ncbi:MAG: hexapeptide transferase, partial [Planctomycetota bacterium]|nr:hexapeptide transferase [Planctomycetota bacterium]
MPHRKDIVIVGAGCEGRIALDILRELGRRAKVLGFLDACAGRGDIPARVAGLPVLGDERLLPGLRRKGVRRVVVALGDNARRAELARAAEEAGLTLLSLIHPSAVVSGGAKAGEGCIIHAGCVIGVDASLG